MSVSNINHHVIIDYTNYRGERGLRRIVPMSIRFENNEWHPDTQWLMEATDVEKGDIRTFSIVNIHSWFRYVPLIQRKHHEQENPDRQAHPGDDGD
jgi:predicted DNA-binding transcriptional regulator YafY